MKLDPDAMPSDELARLEAEGYGHLIAPPRHQAEVGGVYTPPWTLIERYCEHYPNDWRLVFERGDEVLEVSVPEGVWRAFDR